MERWVGKVAIVTGAGSGIGFAVTSKLISDGIIVVGFDIKKEIVDNMVKKLTAKNNKSNIYGIKVDVTNENEIVEGFNWVKKNLGPIHILINCAAVSGSTNLLNGDAQQWKKVLDTNVFGLCLTTREAVRDMKANTVDGHIIHINSVLGHKVVPEMLLNIYGASKYAVTALTETLRMELLQEKSKIKVSSISPGLVKTNIFKSSGFSANFLEKCKKLPLLLPEDVANGILYVLGTPPHVQVCELTIVASGKKY